MNGLEGHQKAHGLYSICDKETFEEYEKGNDTTCSEKKQNKTENIRVRGKNESREVR